MNTCDCETDGFCPRYQQPMIGRMRQICRGEVLTGEVAQQYRDLWAQNSVPPPCRWRGGEMEPGRWRCNSRKILMPLGVTTNQCRQCGVCDHEPVEVNGEPFEFATVDNAVPVGRCPWQGQEVLEDGEAKTKDCPTCSGHVRLKLFQCNHVAREPEEITLQDCRQCAYRPRSTKGAIPLILTCEHSPGDTLASTAAVYSLHRAHPGKYLTCVQGTASEIWNYNPDVVTEDKLGGAPRRLTLHYPLINQSNQIAAHMMSGFCDYLEAQLGVRVPLLTNRPHVYLSTRERSWYSQVQETGDSMPFWLINAGIKSDFTTKQYPHYQRVVDLLRDRVRFVQIGEAGHNHPPLEGVAHNFVGRTDTRQLIRLAYWCQGIVTGVSFPMHLAAALEKPAVVLAGGREARSWNTYPKQALFSTIGQYECCRDGGCWKSRVGELKDGQEQDKSLCEQPAGTTPPSGRCLADIDPERVAEEIWKFSGKGS